MSADAHPAGTVIGQVAATLRYNRAMALKLPAPGESFALEESPLTQSELHRLHDLGAIERVGDERCRSPSGARYTRSRWETVEHVYAWIQTHIGDAPECPAEGCHATGVRCLDAGERYTCTAEDCPETFGPETARELIGR